MKYFVIGTSVYILCFATTDLTRNGGSALPSVTHPRSNRAGSETRNFTKFERERMCGEGAKNAQKKLEPLDTIAMEHYKRRAAFFEKEMDICLAEVEKCHLTLKELKNYLAFSAPPSALTSDLYPSGTAENDLGSSEVTQISITKGGLGNLKKLEDQNVNFTRIIEADKKKMVALLKKEFEFQKRETEFRVRDWAEWDVSIDFGRLITSIKKRVIEPLEELYKLHLPKVLTYENVAEKLTETLNEEEAVYADCLLSKMEDLELIYPRNENSREHQFKSLSAAVDDIVKDRITARSVRWMLFLLVGQHPKLEILRSWVVLNSSLGLYEFCWSVSKLCDVVNEVNEKDSWELKIAYSWLRRAVKEAVESRIEQYGAAGPVLQSINLILKNDFFDSREKQENEHEKLSVGTHR